MEFLSTDPMGYNIHRLKTQIILRKPNGRTEAHQRNHSRSVHIPSDTGTHYSVALTHPECGHIPHSLPKISAQQNFKIRIKQQ
mmetsp:Transcript_25895/g.53159  ORF Transcript_25895/g.53159 Transcript_25895/m.53159 type:complete len:83 (-) Transcript_25895:796-1044(-)